MHTSKAKRSTSKNSREKTRGPWKNRSPLLTKVFLKIQMPLWIPIREEDTPMDISAEAVKKLREKTGVGLMDCKEALKQSNGDMDKALDYLREKGLAKPQKRMGRVASEGTIAS